MADVRDDGGSRRFTDREVALILRKASEIEEEEGRVDGGGLSLTDLREIAREVGISPEAMDRAVLEIGRTRPPAGWAGAPLVRKSVRVVEGELNEAGMARLMRLVDERADSSGSVTEALGAVRWTADDRMGSSQVTVAPEDGRTRIQVVEKTRPRLRRIFHLVPAAWGVMLAGPFLGMIEPSAGLVAAAVALAAAGGAGAGRLVWSVLSSRSQARVGRLAEELAREAEGSVAAGLVADGAGEAPG